MDGVTPLDEIASNLRAKGVALDMQQLHARMWRAGLIEGAPYEGDMARLSSCWATWNIEPLFRGIPASDRAWTLAVTACAAVVAVAVWLAALRGLNPFSFLQASAETGALPLAAALLAGMLLSVIAHEGAHGLAASAFGRIPTRLRALGYFGFIPFFVLTIPGLYTLPPRKRIHVGLAGPVGSLTAAAAAMLLDANLHVGASAHVWLNRFAAVNMIVAVYNFCPLLPTDGYFILSTLLRRPNLRSRAWGEVTALFRFMRRPKAALLIYGLSSLVLMTILVARNIHRLLASTGFSSIGYALVAMIAAMMLAKWFRKVQVDKK
jgi:putative peptide zinc metalloprotease protein